MSNQLPKQPIPLDIYWTGKKKKKKLTRAELEKKAAEIKGKYAWIPYSSEDFCRDKRREIALENRS